MGQKTQTIIIRPAALEGGPEKLFLDLGYEKWRKIGDSEFQHAGSGSIWIAAVGESAIIYSMLATMFFEEGAEENPEFARFREALFHRFPDADIAVLSLHSVIAHWGFAIFRRGKLIRRQHGYDGMVLADEGPRLPVEESYLSRYERYDVNGETYYRDPEHPEYDDMTNPDVGQLLVSEFCKSYTGISLEALRAEGADFWLNDDEEEVLQRIASSHVQSASDSRPWWKFWS